MSDFVDVANALRAKLEADFTSLPLYWPNDDRTPTLRAAPDGFVYSECRVQTEGPVSIGKDGERKHRDAGEFSVMVFVPKGSMVGQVEAYAQEIRNIFTTNAVPNVYITGRRILAGAPSSGPQGKWFAVPIIIEWFSDRIE